MRAENLPPSEDSGNTRPGVGDGLLGLQIVRWKDRYRLWWDSVEEEK